MKTFTLRILFSAFLLLLIGGLALVLDQLCYQRALSVLFAYQNGTGTLTVGRQQIKLGKIERVTALQFAVTDPVEHEYQLDGTDSTNNLTLDTGYLHEIESSLYYRFQSWMRDLDGTSRWRDIQLQADGRIIDQIAWPLDGLRIALPKTSAFTIQLHLQRPETPRSFILLTDKQNMFSVTLNRNDRLIEVTSSGPHQPTRTVAAVFFPISSSPFLAMLLDTFLRTVLWALVLIVLVLLGETVMAIIGRLFLWIGRGRGRGRAKITVPHPLPSVPQLRKDPAGFFMRRWWQLTKALHPVALVALVLSLCFVGWIARVQYQGMPHIYDANAYFFAAKTYATGHLAAPVPSLPNLFPGPFMNMSGENWFSQYPPGTALTLVPGIWLGLPWLVEPLLGTLALLGIGLIAARLYNRKVATLAVILGTLSPFYSYQAASYLSHTITLFYLVWGTWLVMRFLAHNGERGWQLPLAMVFFGMAALTRDMVGLLYIVLLLAGLIVRYHRRIRWQWRDWRVPIVFAGVVALGFVALEMSFNALLTGYLFISPRTLFSASDHWGFGVGVGFYGAHTLAAGLVNLDEQLTILAIDLYGWPFYLTFAFLLIPFLLRRATAVDWFCLIAFSIVACSFIGYFYHGIYLGPRYLFETLPFLLILTARGILILAEFGESVRQTIQGRLFKNRFEVEGGEFSGTKGRGIRFLYPGSLITVLIVVALIACNLIYFMPRQIELHRDYSGFPVHRPIDTTAIYQSPVHHAVVVTGNQYLYQMVLFPLNDPFLQGDVIYALAGGTSKYAALHQAFPDRKIFQIEVNLDGSVRYVPITKFVPDIPWLLSQH